MANWIKVDVNTPHKEGVSLIMETCQCDRANAFLAWFNLYVWLDAQTATGTVNVTREEVDRIAGIVGVSAALEQAGWLTFRGHKCYVSNWQEHNGQSARARSEQMANLSKRRWHPSPPSR